MEDDLIDPHKQNKDQILKALNDNRGKDPLMVSKIRNMIDFVLKDKEIQPYLLELINEKMIKEKKGKTYKAVGIGARSKETKTSRYPDTYYITEPGTEYVKNGFYKLKVKSEISKLVEINLQGNELLTSILQVSNLSLTEQQKQSDLMSMLTDALDSNDDSKARSVLIKGLGIGKEVAVPLMVEYFKKLVLGV